MCVEVIPHHANDLGFRTGFTDQPLHAMGEVLFGALFGDFDMPIARLWFKEHEQVPRTVAFVLVIKPLHLTTTGGQRLPRFLVQLLTVSSKTDLGLARIIGFSIQIQDILHCRDKLSPDLRNAPLLLLPGFQVIFSTSGGLFRVKPTLLRLIRPICPPTIAAASGHDRRAQHCTSTPLSALLPCHPA